MKNERRKFTYEEEEVILIFAIQSETTAE